MKFIVNIDKIIEFIVISYVHPVTPYGNNEINFSYERETYSYKSPGSKIKEYKRTYAQQTVSAPSVAGSVFGISLDAVDSFGGTSTSGLNYSNTII